MEDSSSLPAKRPSPDAGVDLPPVLAGRATPEVAESVRRFYLSVAEIFEAWVQRRRSVHTRRAYRLDVLTFVRFLGQRCWPDGFRWPEESWKMLRVSVVDVITWRDAMVKAELAPKTINRRVSSLSAFFKYLQGAAAELRLPITVPNPAHAQFIERSGYDPVEETRSLSQARARQLMNMPSGDSLLDARDRAILKVMLYTGVRIGTVARLDIKDFHDQADGAELRVSEKGNKRRTIGIHHVAAEAIREYVLLAGISSGPLFRARRGSRSLNLSERRIGPTALYELISSYLRRLPGAAVEDRGRDGEIISHFAHTPHSLRATTATLLLSAGVDIAKVQELLGHKHLTTTQIYDKRRRTTAESASHDVPI